MYTGIVSPVAGLTTERPVATPVLAPDPAVRCRSLSREAASWYARTASHTSPGTSAISPATSGCSGASTIYVAPVNVSGRVVNTSIGGPVSIPTTGNVT